MQEIVEKIEMPVLAAVAIGAEQFVSHLDHTDHTANQSAPAHLQNFAQAEIVDSLRFPRFVRLCPSILTELSSSE